MRTGRNRCRKSSIVGSSPAEQDNGHDAGMLKQESNHPQSRSICAEGGFARLHSTPLPENRRIHQRALVDARRAERGAAGCRPHRWQPRDSSLAAVHVPDSTDDLGDLTLRDW